VVFEPGTPADTYGARSLIDTVLVGRADRARAAALYHVTTWPGARSPRVQVRWGEGWAAFGQSERVLPTDAHRQDTEMFGEGVFTATLDLGIRRAAPVVYDSTGPAIIQPVHLGWLLREVGRRPTSPVALRISLGPKQDSTELATWIRELARSLDVPVYLHIDGARLAELPDTAFEGFAFYAPAEDVRPGFDWALTPPSVLWLGVGERVPRGGVPRPDGPAAGISRADVSRSDGPAGGIPRPDVPGSTRPGAGTLRSDDSGSDRPAMGILRADVSGSDGPAGGIPGSDVSRSDRPGASIARPYGPGANVAGTTISGAAIFSADRPAPADGPAAAPVAAVDDSAAAVTNPSAPSARLVALPDRRLRTFVRDASWHGVGGCVVFAVPAELGRYVRQAEAIEQDGRLLTAVFAYSRAGLPQVTVDGQDRDLAPAELAAVLFRHAGAAPGVELRLVVLDPIAPDDAAWRNWAALTAAATGRIVHYAAPRTNVLTAEPRRRGRLGTRPNTDHPNDYRLAAPAGADPTEPLWRTTQPGPGTLCSAFIDDHGRLRLTADAPQEK
jgi:hypothetical protein